MSKTANFDTSEERNLEVEVSLKKKGETPEDNTNNVETDSENKLRHLIDLSRQRLPDDHVKYHNSNIVRLLI